MFLEKLSNASAPSGYEGEVRKIILSEIKPYVDEVKVDKMGNIIAHKKGKGKKVVLDAHMDEVGFIITSFNEDGTLKFDTLGNVNSRSIASRSVLIGKEKIPGVIGLKPIHLQTSDERKKSIKCSDCCIDIGANSKEEAKRYIRLGDYAVCDVKFESLGEEMLKGKAFNGRVGCAVLVDILKQDTNIDLYGVFTVQQQVGLRGAYVAAYDINPDIVIALNAVLCDDRPDVSKHLMSTEMGKGTAISLMDRNAMNSEFIDEIVTVAKEEKIQYQFITTSSESNNQSAYLMSQEGCSAISLGVPCRYMHSSISVVSKSDIKNTKELVLGILKRLG